MVVGDSETAPLGKRRKLDSGEIDIDDVIDVLLAVRTKPAHQQDVRLPLDSLNQLCHSAQEIFQSQPMLLEVEAPMKLAGDTHGQYHDLLRLFEHGGFPPTANYLFLGDYVDRGKKSLETVCLLFAYKIKFPENFFLLRGNHESPSISRIYGFYDECKRRYNIKVWKTFLDVFNHLPVCAVVDERVVCMHGGLSQEMLYEGAELKTLVNQLERPADIPDTGILCDLLWSDPHPEVQGFGANDRGVSVSFGADVVNAFLVRENLDLVVRAHQVVEDGYEFFCERRLVTIFSAPNYCGEFDNAASLMNIGEDLVCSFTVLKPALPSL